MPMWRMAVDLQVIDISTPTAPAIVGSVDIPGDAYDVSIASGYAYVADSRWICR